MLFRSFPPVVRDIALLVDAGVSSQSLLDVAHEARPAFVQAIRLFDLYQGPNLPKGKKSLAFRVVMQDTARTLTDEEADAIKAGLLNVLKARFGAKLRA